MQYRSVTPFLALLCVLFVWAVPAQAGYRIVHEPSPDDPMQVRIFELDNGMQVYVTENHQTPRFYAEIAVRAGSKDDPAETTGLAHYLEHLLFKGTKKIGTTDYERRSPTSIGSRNSIRSTSRKRTRKSARPSMRRSTSRVKRPPNSRFRTNSTSCIGPLAARN